MLQPVQSDKPDRLDQPDGPDQPDQTDGPDQPDGYSTFLLRSSLHNYTV